MIFSPNYRFKDHLSLICKRTNSQHKVLFTDWMQASIRNMPSKENQFLYHCEDSCFGGNASSIFLMYNNFLEKVKKINYNIVFDDYISGNIYHENYDINAIYIPSSYCSGEACISIQNVNLTSKTLDIHMINRIKPISRWFLLTINLLGRISTPLANLNFMGANININVLCNINRNAIIFSNWWKCLFLKALRFGLK